MLLTLPQLVPGSWLWDWAADRCLMFSRGGRKGLLMAGGAGAKGSPPKAHFPLRRIPPEELASVHSNILGSLCLGLGWPADEAAKSLTHQ